MPEMSPRFGLISNIRRIRQSRRRRLCSRSPFRWRLPVMRPASNCWSMRPMRLATSIRSRVCSPEPCRSEVAKLIDQYVACRLHDYSTVLDEEEVAAANLTCVRLQNQLWSQAVGAVAKNRAPVPTGLLLSSLEDVSNMAAKRDATRENHVPQPVLTFLFLVAILTLALLAYGCGLGNHRHMAATATVCLLISLVVPVIMDLDRPGVD
jgi:hypothetical protein